MEPLAPALARHCSADWTQSFEGAQRSALASIVRTAFVDTAACILAGRAEAASQVVAGWMRPQLGEAGAASVWFGTQRAEPATAALLNGVAGHALDFDDVGLAGHPSVVLVPALLAEQERTGARGFALVQAYAKGYATWGELQRRMQVHLHARGWHPSAVFGGVATAAAIGSLRGLNASQLAHALGIASSLASGVIANFGSMTKPLHLGRAAQAGIQAVELAQAGLDARPDALDGPAGLLVALAGDLSRVDLASPLPADFATTLLRVRPGIKNYPVCYAAHRCVDGVVDLMREHAVAYSAVERIEAEISETAAGVLRHHAPADVTEARFSLEFTLAAAVAHGRLGVAEVSPAVLHEPAVRSLMARVATRTVQTRCPIEPSFAYTDQVRLVLRDGRVLESGPIRFARGHAEHPLDEAALREKLFACAGPDDEALAQRVLARLEGMLA